METFNLPHISVIIDLSVKFINIFCCVCFKLKLLTDDKSPHPFGDELDEQYKQIYF